MHARNPWLQDPAIDYDMDSEDELAEEQGEDLNSKQDKDSDEEMLSEDEAEPGFIVSDGHLSVEEYNFSQDEGDDQAKLKEIEARRSRLREKQDSKEVGKVYVQTDGLELFKAVAFSGRTLPLSLEKPARDPERGDPNAILQHRVQLLRLAYANVESKQCVVDEMHTAHPECSKKSIERVFKESMTKEKRGSDVR